MQTSNPKVSIILPCYGVEQYIDRCLESIINQSLNDIEIILIDDGSPDKTPEMCDRWAKKDSRIKVVHKSNAGLGFARNSGLDIATGKYVAFIDSDDYVDLSMFQRLIEASEDGLMDVVFCGLRQETSSGGFNYIHDYDKEIKFNSLQAEHLALSFIHKTELNRKERLFMSVWHGIYKRDLIEKLKLRFYSERDILSEDIPFQFEFCKNAQNIKFIPDYLYTYCLNGGSLTHRFNENKFDSAIRLRNLLLKLTDNCNDGRYFVDAEFYGRLRYLTRQLVFANNYSFIQKYNILKRLSIQPIVQQLQIEKLYKEEKWKYTKQYDLLKSGKVFFLILFSFFDKYLNKQNLMFWKKQY